MHRSALGLLVGGCSGFALGFLAAAAAENRGDSMAGVFIGSILSGTMAMAGAIVGAVGDLLAFLRQTMPARPKPEEADYRDLLPPTGP